MRTRQKVDRDYDYFVRSLSGLLEKHTGEFAQLRAYEIVGYFPGLGESDRAILSQTEFPLNRNGRWRLAFG